MTLLLTLANLQNPPTGDDWNTGMLGTAKTIGLPTTAWQPGSIERSLFAVMANVDRLQGVSASLVAQAGFLSFAATGYVDTVDPDGTASRLYVTPDPSIPAQNPNGALGWLDVLALGAYNVKRILSTFAGGPLALLNTSASTYGPFAPGTFHVAQAAKAGVPGYTNAASLTIIPGIHTANPVTGTTNVGGVVQVTVVAHGQATGATVFLAGVLGTIEANDGWVITVTSADTFILNGSTFANAWVAGGSQLVWRCTLASFIADAPGTTSNAATPNVVQSPVTSLIGVSVGNPIAWLGSDIEGNVALAARCRLKLAALALNGPAAALVYFALSSQQLAPGLNPPQIVASAITRAVVALDPTTGTATVTVANETGAPSGPDTTPGTDCYAALLVIQAYAVLFASTVVVNAATPLNVTAAPTVVLPLSFATVATATIVTKAVNAFFAALPIGGIDVPSGPQNVVPLNGVVGAIAQALAANSVPYTDIILTLNGLALDVALSTVDVATLTLTAPVLKGT